MDGQKIFMYAFAAIGAVLFVICFILPAAMHSARIRPNEKRSVPLAVPLDTFIRRFDEKAAGQKGRYLSPDYEFNLSPYYVYRWKTVGKSFSIGLIMRSWLVITLHATIERDRIVYTLAGAGMSAGYSEREEVRKIEALLKALAGDRAAGNVAENAQ